MIVPAPSVPSPAARSKSVASEGHPNVAAVIEDAADIRGREVASRGRGAGTCVDSASTKTGIDAGSWQPRRFRSRERPCKALRSCTRSRHLLRRRVIAIYGQDRAAPLSESRIGARGGPCPFRQSSRSCGSPIGRWSVDRPRRRHDSRTDAPDATDRRRGQEPPQKACLPSCPSSCWFSPLPCVAVVPSRLGTASPTRHWEGPSGRPWRTSHFPRRRLARHAVVIRAWWRLRLGLRGSRFRPVGQSPSGTNRCYVKRVALLRALHPWQGRVSVVGLSWDLRSHCSCLLTSAHVRTSESQGRDHVGDAIDGCYRSRMSVRHEPKSVTVGP